MNKVQTHMNYDDFGKGKFKYLPPDVFIIQHPFILSNFKMLQINKLYLVLYSGVYDPFIQAVRLLKVWNEKNVVWMEFMNLEKCKVEIYGQDLDSDEYDFLIVSMVFLDACVKLANKKGGKVVD